jgi:hypothetical protein
MDFVLVLMPIVVSAVLALSRSETIRWLFYSSLQLSIAVLSHPLALVLPTLPAYRARDVRRISAVLEITSARGHQC